MNSKRRQRLLDNVGPLLEADERVEVTALGTVGSVSAGRKIATAAVVGVLTGGTVMALVTAKPMYMVVTDRRILFVEQNPTGGPGKKVLMTVHRGGVSVSAPKKGMFGLTMVVELAIAGEEKGLKITFPHASKREGREFIAALPQH